MSKIKLELGKTYRTRGGELVKLTHQSIGNAFPFSSDPLNGMFSSWCSEGYCFGAHEPHSRDLIAEVCDSTV